MLPSSEKYDRPKPGDRVWFVNSFGWDAGRVLSVNQYPDTFDVRDPFGNQKTVTYESVLWMPLKDEEGGLNRPHGLPINPWSDLQE